AGFNGVVGPMWMGQSVIRLPAGRQRSLYGSGIFRRGGRGGSPTIQALEMHHLNDILPWAAAGGAVLAFLAAMLAWLRPPAADARLEALLEGLERTERALRADIAEGQRGLRGEFSESARALRAELAQSQEELRAGLSRDAQA